MAAEPAAHYATMIRDLPEGEKPRERLRNLGPGQLSNPELIAILLRVGSRGENVLNLATRSISISVSTSDGSRSKGTILGPSDGALSGS